MYVDNVIQNTVEAFGRFLKQHWNGGGGKLEEFTLYHTDKLERHVFPTSFVQDCRLLRYFMIFLNQDTLI